MSRFVRTLTLGCFLSHLCLTATTFAGEVPTLAEARAAFVEGRDLIEREKWEEAEERFRFAARAKNTPGLKYYVAYCQERAGQLVEAFATYEEAAELLKITPAADVEDLIPEARERVRTALPQLAIQGVPEGALALVDGEKLAKPLAGPVNPGKHELRVQAEGFQPFETELELEAGAVEVLNVELLPIVEAKNEPLDEALVASPPKQGDIKADSTQESSLRPIVFWGSVGLGTVGLAAGIYGTIARGSASRDVREANSKLDELAMGSASICSSPVGEAQGACEKLQNGLKRKDTSEVVMIGGFSTTAIGVAGALLTHFLWKESAVTFGGNFTPTRTELSIRGAF